MTDEQITLITALEHIKAIEQEDVVLDYEDVCLLLDLINRQKAEIERMKKLLAEEEAKYKECAKRFYKEAIKEFAERLKTNVFEVDDINEDIFLAVEVSYIDHLVKEMVGDTE